MCPSARSAAVMARAPGSSPARPPRSGCRSGARCRRPCRGSPPRARAPPGSRPRRGRPTGPRRRSTVPRRCPGRVSRRRSRRRRRPATCRRPRRARRPRRRRVARRRKVDDDVAVPQLQELAPDPSSALNAWSPRSSRSVTVCPATSAASAERVTASAAPGEARDRRVHDRLRGRLVRGHRPDDGHLLAVDVVLAGADRPVRGQVPVPGRRVPGRLLARAAGRRDRPPGRRPSATSATTTATQAIRRVVCEAWASCARSSVGLGLGWLAGFRARRIGGGHRAQDARAG